MKRIIFLFLATFLCLNGNAQEIRSYVISSTGGSIMGETGALYLSVGEPFNTELSDGEIMIAQGFLQVSIVETTDTEDILEEEINVFPNPSSAEVILELPQMKGSYRYQLFNSMGSEIRLGDIESIRTKVDLSSVSSGTYFLKVIKGSESSKTLKIIKL